MIQKLLIVPCLCLAILSTGQTFNNVQSDQIPKLFDVAYLFKAPNTNIPDLVHPTSAAIGMDGHVFIADDEKASVLEFDESGNLLNIVSSVQTKSGSLKLDEPSHLFIDSKNTLYIHDEGLGKIIVKPTAGSAFAFGEKGSTIGQIDDVRGLVADSQGYIYVLNGAADRVDVFEPDGDYLTWISGGYEPFKNPIAIGINGRNDLYVLDKNGPSVIMFDVAGNQVNMHRNFTSWKKMLIEDPLSMAVMKNGDFFIMDRKTFKITQVNRIGEVIGSFGTKGPSSKGSFMDAIAIGGNVGKDMKLMVVDQEEKQVQVFSVASESPDMTPENRVVRVETNPSNVTSLLHVAYDTQGVQYIVPSDNPTLVVARKDGQELFAINHEFKDISDITTDGENRLYVVDRKQKQVFVFDAKGVLVRSLGQEIKDRLKDPTSIVVQSNGNVVINDQSTGTIHQWNAQGIYQKVITKTSNSVLGTINDIDKDQLDRIYILDHKSNSVYRASSSGWPVEAYGLKARPERVDNSPGKIAAFFVDPLNQVYIYNSTTHQIEVYEWEVEPILKFSFGYPGVGMNAFGKVDDIVLDPHNFYVHCLGKGEDKVVQFMVKPPIPDSTVTFTIGNGNVNIAFKKLNNDMVTGYGLVTIGSYGQDTIAAQTSTALISLNEAAISDLQLHRYDFVSLSQSDFSHPALSFDNYLGYGDRLLKANLPNEAIQAYEKAISYFGESIGIADHISRKLSNAALELSNQAEVGKAVNCINMAYTLAPKDKEVRSNAVKVLYSYFSELARVNDIVGIIRELDRAKQVEGYQSIALDAANEVCEDLGQTKSVESTNNGIIIGKKLHKLDHSNPNYTRTLSLNLLALFNLQSSRGVSSLELEVIIHNAESYMGHCVEYYRQMQEPFFDDHIMQLQMYNISGNHTVVEIEAVKVLNEYNDELSVDQILAYRRALAKAYYGMGDYATAVLEIKRMNTLDDSSREVQEDLAASLFANGDLDEAKAIYKSLLLSDVENAKYAAEIGKIELKKENYAEATFQLEKAINQDPSNQSFYGPLAEAFEGISNNVKSLEAYKVAVQYQLKVKEQSKSSITSFQESQAIDKQLFNYQLKVAALNDVLGFDEDAIAAYAQLIAWDPTNGQAYFGLGTSSLKAGVVYDALAAFEQACKLEPSNKIYEEEYARTIRVRKNVEQNETPLSIVDVQVKDVFPSLYRNYADNRLLPLGQVVISNNTDLPITPNAVSVFIQDLMESPIELTASTVVGFSNNKQDLIAIFDERILEQTEDKQMQVEVTVLYDHEGQTKSVSRSTSFVLHGRNAIMWSDKRRLAAFVAPSVEILIDYNTQASQFFNQALSYSINTRMLKAMQIYTLLDQSDYTYIPDPNQSYASVSTNTEVLDYLFYPIETMKRRGGDCDDLVVLYAALLENAGVETAYIDMPGHVMMAFNTGIRADQMEQNGLIKRDVIVYSNELWIPVETTLLGKHTFLTAWKKGAEGYYQTLNEGEYPEIVPMSEARKVYVPSNFTPKGYTPEPITNEDVLNAYESQVEGLYGKLNDAVLRNLETRYQTEPGNLFVKNKYAVLLVKTGETEKAERILKEGLEMSPSNSVILNNLGNVNLITGDAKDAIRYYTLSTNADNADGETYINLCKAYLMAGNKEEANNCYAKALALDEELGYLYDELKTQLR